MELTEAIIKWVTLVSVRIKHFFLKYNNGKCALMEEYRNILNGNINHGVNT